MNTDERTQGLIPWCVEISWAKMRCLRTGDPVRSQSELLREIRVVGKIVRGSRGTFEDVVRGNLDIEAVRTLVAVVHLKCFARGRETERVSDGRKPGGVSEFDDGISPRLARANARTSGAAQRL